MKNLYISRFSLLTVILIICYSCGQPPPKAAFECHVVISSGAGGSVNVDRIDPVAGSPFVLPMEVGWAPPRSNSNLDFQIGYFGSAFDRVANPSGGHLSFPIQKREKAIRYDARALVGNKVIAQFSGKDIEVGFDSGSVLIDKDSNSGHALIDAVARGDSVQFDVLEDGHITMSSKFNTSDIKARDELMGRALELVKKKDPSVCKAIH